ncbi:hypothetical protein Salat_2635500 [Sesamum alatum]|uniref:Reverse transcriptase zinc-binding domain-containing protein n=1 Tax=Sesamum alatum TaxID=300844 RepID=A0AAE1XNR1_9LAMI|nr:hypothetical protein Salat_2635500 [Sesamum alatum]
MVGNGCNIKVWRDRWLPRATTFRPIRVPEQANEELTIAELIERLGEDGMKTCYVLLSFGMMLRAADDMLVWHYLKNGRFSVRSAYNLARADTQKVRGGSSRHTRKTDWDFIWRANAPHGVQLFGWKACKQAVATTENLIKRRLYVDDFCCKCGARSEDVHHVLLGCCYETWMRYVASELDCSQFGWFLVVCWTLWNSRNAALMEHKLDDPQTLIQQARKYMIAFREANSVRESATQSTPPTKWSRPTRERIKVNFDGDPMHIEALAARRAVELVLKLGWENVIMEGDCLGVVQPLGSGSIEPTQHAPVLMETSGLGRSIPRIEWNLVRRTTNIPAHSLAQCAKSDITFEVLPQTVNLAILADISDNK